MRATLLAQTREILDRAGYYLSTDSALRPLSFDIVARRDDELLLLKVLTNVDGLTEPVANELRIIAQFLDAAPLVVGERSSSRPLEDGAVYLRYGVNIVTFDTLREYLQDGVEPLVYAAPGGFYVNLDGAKLRALREGRGLSLGDLAQAAGVSRRAIGMYEEGMGAMVEVAMRLEDFLEETLALPSNPFQAAPPQAPQPDDIKTSLHGLGPGFEGTVLRHMTGLGFRVMPTMKSPFSAISKENLGPDVVLSGVADEMPDLEKRASATANLCDVTETYGVFFVERTTTRVAIEGMPVLSRQELEKVNDPEALLKILQERRGKKR
ncbi:MAG: transcriptional regulator [Candidatus Thermoplasmatota archaeon]